MIARILVKPAATKPQLLMLFALVFTMASVAVALPIPQAAGKLPIGLQWMAPAGHEARVLAIACELEQLLGRQAPPPMA